MVTIQDIGKRFTRRVNQYISKGYHLCVNTMGGSQGEYAKVDLTNGKDFVRILIVSTTDGIAGSKVTIRVAHSENARYSNWHEIVWNEKLKTITEDTFYSIDTRRSVYGTKKEADAAHDKHIQRAIANEVSDYIVRFESERAKRIFLPYVRENLRGCKSARLSDISVYKQRGIYDGSKKYTYYVECRGRIARLS